MRTLRPVATLALSGLLGLAALSGCSGDDEVPVPQTTGATSNGPVIQPGLPGQPNETLSGGAATNPPAPTVARGDVTFYQDMIVHHAQAVVMVETALPRLSDTQVKALASRIADEHKPEILTMTTSAVRRVSPQTGCSSPS